MQAQVIVWNLRPRLHRSAGSELDSFEGRKPIEFTLPFLFAVKVEEGVIKAAEKRIVIFDEGHFGRIKTTRFLQAG
jgi:hypothetical protein